MKFENLENAQIIYRVKSDTAYGAFSDALYFSLPEWESLSEDDLNKQVQTRIDNWIAAVTTPFDPPKPTEEELSAAAAERKELYLQAEALKEQFYPSEKKEI